MNATMNDTTTIPTSSIWTSSSPTAAPSPFVANPSTPTTRRGSLNSFQNTQTLVIAILIGCVCFLLTVLIAVMAPYFFPAPSPPRTTTATTTERRESVDSERIKRRYKTITNWLITKEVLEHDQKRCGVAVVASKERHHDEDHGAIIDNTTNNSNNNATEQNHDSIDDGSSINNDRKDCHICMEPFQVGDKVSWSATGHCNHTYHFLCIEEWLMKKKDCPDCRQTMLLVDDGFTDIVPLVEAKKRYEALTFFCQQDGLIAIPSTAVSPATRSAYALTAAVKSPDERGGDEHEAGDVIDDKDAYDYEPPLGSNAIVEAAIFDETNDEDNDLEAAQGSNNV